MTMSVTTITAIALQRYQILIKKRTHTKLVNQLPLIFAWIVGLVFGIPVFVYQTTEPVRDDIYGQLLYERCVEKWPVPWGKGAFTGIIIFNQYILPIVIIAFVHSQIIKLINVDKQIRKSPIALRRENQRNRKTTMLLVKAALTFLLSWLPFHIFHALAEYTDIFVDNTVNMYLCFAVAHMVAMSSTLWNPLLYGFGNENIKHEIIELYTSNFRSEIRVNAFLTNIIQSHFFQKYRSTDVPSEVASTDMNTDQTRVIEFRLSNCSKLSTPSHHISSHAVTAV